MTSSAPPRVCVHAALLKPVRRLIERSTPFGDRFQLLGELNSATANSVTIQSQEGVCNGKSGSLVTIDKRLVLRNSNGEHCGSADDIRIVVEGRHLGPGNRGLKFILRADTQ